MRLASTSLSARLCPAPTVPRMYRWHYPSTSIDTMASRPPLPSPDSLPTTLPQWLTQLRRTHVVDRLNQDTRTTAGTILGIDPEVAKTEVAGWGQADFDAPWGSLSSTDRALIYAYFFQLGHLEELTSAFRLLFPPAERPTNPIVVDLGCGPFTGGLALAAVLGPNSPFEYIGVDHSGAMRDFGASLARAAMFFREVPPIRHRWAASVPSVSWSSAPAWRPVVVIVSYLLASPTLDTTQLVAELEALLARLGRGPATVLYTNSPRPNANRSFPAFRAALCRVNFRLVADDQGTITIDRWHGLRDRRLRYALFHRTQQTTLCLRTP